ncbi:PASTA domain-containing protein [Desulfobotulus sp. H1]|uniref:PASTA domain-containing protein n=1 Tax=Desulfobotulus pelophilus TaxID=2823377 RepID=A0ABT3N8H1_9BACT|nr:PASTA domain-containing protein [Desulfobotulus pelophilus]MCW7753750.1 PASTA domain-containing protein [Desulfobotulus pelophilus]
MMKKSATVIKIAKGLTGLMLFCGLAALGAYFSLSFLLRSTSEIVVPDLREKDIVEVLERMEAARIGVRVAGFEFSGALPQNYVLRQDPLPGHVLKEGREVRVFLSRGVQKFAIPDTRGLRKEEALSRFRNMHFQPGHITTVFHEALPQGHVVASDPPSGSLAANGTSIHLLVSSGKRPVMIRMPDLGGMHADEMLAIVEKSLLRITDIQSTWVPDMPLNRVMDQHPTPGTQVTARSGITVYINRDPDHKRDSLDILSGMRLIRYRLPHTLIRSHIRGTISAWGTEFDFVNDVFDGNREISLLIPGTTEAHIRIEENGFPVYEARLDPFSTRSQILYDAGQYGMSLIPPSFLYKDRKPVTENSDESVTP